MARTSLLPGIFKTCSANKDQPRPLKLFELSDVVLIDSSNEVGARNERRVAALYSDKSSGFEIIHSLIDRIMQVRDSEGKAAWCCVLYIRICMYVCMMAFNAQ